MKLPFLLSIGLSLPAMILSASAATALWQAPTGEFSVDFFGKPEVEAVAARPAEGTSRLDIAAYQQPELIEHAEGSVNQRTRPITKDEAMRQGAAWAKFTGVFNEKLSYDEFHPDDRRLTVKGVWKVEGRPMNITAVMHWGKKTFLLVFVSEPQNTAEGARFLESVKQSFK